MAKSEKQKLQDKAKKLGVKFTDRTTIKDLEAAIAKAEAVPAASGSGEGTPESAPSAEGAEGSTQDAATAADTREDAQASADDVDADKDGKSIEPTGKFVVVEFKKGHIRLFNEKGQAVSPIHKTDEKDEHGVPQRTRLARAASRSNALIRGRQLRTPAGHDES